MAVSVDFPEFLCCLQKRHDALKHRESQLLKQVEDLQKDCLRNLADRQNEVSAVENMANVCLLKSGFSTAN